MEIQRLNTIQIFSIILILVVLGLFSLTKLGIIKVAPAATITPSPPAGVTVLSANKADFISNDPQLNKSGWLINVVAGGGEHLKGAITPEDIGVLSRLGYRTEKQFDLYLDIENVGCAWNIIDENKSIYSISTGSRCVSYGYNYPVGSAAPAVGGGIILNSVIYKNEAATCEGKTYPSLIYWSTYGSARCTRTYYAGCLNYVIDPQYIGFRLDTTTQFTWEAKVTVSLNGKNYTGMLNPQQQTVNIQDPTSNETIGRVKFVGSLLASTFCPAPYNDVAFIRRAGTMDLMPVSKFAYQDYFSKLNSYLVSRSSESSVLSAKAAYEALVASKPPIDYTCNFKNVSATETIYQCNPIQPVILPEFQIFLTTDLVGVVVPVGKPQITDIDLPPEAGFEAGVPIPFNVTVKNIGTADDNFLVKAVCPKQISLIAMPSFVGVGQEVKIPVSITGAGIIQNCNITVYSQQQLNNLDWRVVRISIRPFCDKPPEPGKKMVMTEYGCYWVCPDIQYENDTDAECNPVITPEDYAREVNESGMDKHCTDLKTMISARYYFEAVPIGLLPRFIPKKIDHAYFIGAPTCNYVGEYGYHWNGTGVQQVLDEVYVFDPTKQPISASEQAAKCLKGCPTGQTQSAFPDCSCTGTPVCATPCPSGNQNPYPDCSCVGTNMSAPISPIIEAPPGAKPIGRPAVLTPIESAKSFIAENWIAIVIIIIAIGGAYYFTQRR